MKTASPARALIFALLLCFPAPSGEAVTCPLKRPFAASPVQTLPQSAAAMTIADFNHDGIPDIAALSLANFAHGVSIQLGVGDGTFQAPVWTPTDDLTTSFVVADFNHDDKADVAVGYFGGGGVVLLGNGDGTFQPPIPFSTDISLNALAAADLDGDGAQDLVAAGYGVAVLLGNGDGTFQPGTDYLFQTDASGIAIGDFNGNGDLDLAVSHSYTNLVTILPGNGDGTFGAALTTNIGAPSSDIRTADLDGDGKLDLVMISAKLDAILGEVADVRRNSTKRQGPRPSPWSPRTCEDEAYRISSSRRRPTSTPRLLTRS